MRGARNWRAPGRHIVVAQDTTEINFAGRAANRCGLGAAGDGVSAGFFIHPLVAIDSETEAVLGLLDAQIWTRDDAIEAAPRRQRAIEDKESMRWLRGVDRAGELLTDAASVVVVGDRESDIYSCFARRPAGVDLIVRAAQDRRPSADRTARLRGSLFANAASWPELTQMLVQVAPRRVGDPGRIATVALRAGPVILKRPRHGSAKTDPETVSMTLVEAREINPPANQEPLHWRLLTVSWLAMPVRRATSCGYIACAGASISTRHGDSQESRGCWGSICTEAFGWNISPVQIRAADRQAIAGQRGRATPTWRRGVRRARCRQDWRGGCRATPDIDQGSS